MSLSTVLQTSKVNSWNLFKHIDRNMTINNSSLRFSIAIQSSDSKLCDEENCVLGIGWWPFWISLWWEFIEYGSNPSKVIGHCNRRCSNTLCCWNMFKKVAHLYTGECGIGKACYEVLALLFATTKLSSEQKSPSAWFMALWTGIKTLCISRPWHSSHS